MTDERRTDDATLQAYTVMHQPLKPGNVNAYESGMLALHGAIARASQAMIEEQTRRVGETTAQFALQLGGALSEFLSTPIRSDAAEVQRIFREAFEHSCRLSGDTGAPGVLGSTEGVFVPPGGTLPPRTKLLATTQYVKSLGFAATRAGASVYETMVVFRGSKNLDLLEHIVRERIGVYRSEHGEHIAVPARFVAGLSNVVCVTDGYAFTGLAGIGEVVLCFDKPKIEYTAVRDELSAHVHVLGALDGIRGAGLWQRKLGLGRGAEFMIRCTILEEGAFGGFVRALKGLSGNADVLEAMRTKGTCFLKKWVVANDTGAADEK
jgi:hypothetical protein